jgi:outer membrane protein assembly factor BamD (BamD/ComL family)
MLNLQQENVAEAIKYFEEIPKKYPNYPGAKNIIYLIVDSAGKLGKQDVVRTYTAKMIDNYRAYTADQLIRVGMLLMSFEMYDLAESLLGIVSEHPDAKSDPRIEQRALNGLATSAFKRGNYAEALKAADEFLTKYPNSASKLDMMFLQAACHRELGDCDRAMAVLGQVTEQTRDLRIKYADRVEEFNAAELKKEAELALTNAKCKDINGAINSVFLLLKTRVARSDAEKAIMKDMCLKGIDWCIEAKKWKIGEELCNIFLERWALDKENGPTVKQKRSQCQSNQ